MIKESDYKLGDRFKRRLPKFVGRIGDMSDLFQAEDKEFNVIDQLIFDFSQAMHIANLKRHRNPITTSASWKEITPFHPPEALTSV